MCIHAYLTENPLSLPSPAGDMGALSVTAVSTSSESGPKAAGRGLGTRTQGDWGRDCMDRMRAWDTWLLKERILPRLSPSRPLRVVPSVGGEAFKGRLRVLRMASSLELTILSGRAVLELQDLLG